MSQAPRTPVERLFDSAKFTCTACGAARGKCDCWTPCACGWSYAKGTACKNPNHDRDIERSVRRANARLARNRLG
jgi:ribosomal protein L37AE/L43A